ncbi:MAG: bifunctional phosphoribosylaminoimidazolecarboxamide formyltransferase/IMP cyclohydrolase [Rhodospirillales bacterium]|nr:bifunctional phosphoribosylaminoimidazolecarboxamide formyltransferase/IMP cyclohydrolase [Rhodospirillales bacterium]
MTHSIKRALISVSDKTGLIALGQFLSQQGVEILSTGGSAKALRDAGIAVIEVSDFTGFPEIMDGRVKTLQPKIHGGLLAVRGNPNHEQAMHDHGIENIDLLAVNLYPFEATVAAGADFETCIENIDIGGPALIRAAAKNHKFVTVVVDPADYSDIIDEMTANNGTTSAATRKKCAAKAYARTGAYDAAISGWFNAQTEQTFPTRLAIAGTLRQTLRYGENPHQQAAFYANSENRAGVATATQLQGKELSFNNFNDTDAAFELVAEFSDGPACVIVKHANPCGVAVGETLSDAYGRALACDTESAFGGIIAVNRTLDAKTATELAKLFAEVIIAPKIDSEALTILAARKNLRVLVTDGLPDPAATAPTIRTLAGGYLLQGRDNKIFDELKVVSKRPPSDREMADLRFAFIVAKHVKSNAIVYAKDGATVGVGAGQMSRINSSRIAAWKAADAAKVAGDEQSWAIGSVVASDAFFPFADGLVSAAEAGATAVIQPGGSMRDDEVIAAADAKNLAMVFTGMRHFRH